ncbi:MAG: hypothetical protein JXA14_13440 [Anaerolineae bacterium]|nr:hypothetical protein [Anaerolineae bacterium]
MNETCTIMTTGVHDIMTARAKVRDLARRKGLGITDQARISLATSSIADVMGLGTHRHGQIVVDSIEETERVGIRVICTTAKEARSALDSSQVDVHRLMVDDLIVETLPSGDVEAILIQWSARRNA